MCMRDCLKTASEASESAEHEADHREGNERLAGGTEALVILRMKRSLLLSLEETVTLRYSDVGRSSTGSLPVELDTAQLW